MMDWLHGQEQLHSLMPKELTPTIHTLYLKWNIKTSKTYSGYIKFQIKMHYVFHSKKGYEDEMDALYKIFT